MKKVDMHTHTNLSNGSESSIYVLQQAQKKAEQYKKDDMTVIAGRFWEIY